MIVPDIGEKCSKPPTSQTHFNQHSKPEIRCWWSNDFIGRSRYRLFATWDELTPANQPRQFETNLLDSHVDVLTLKFGAGAWFEDKQQN